MRARTGAAFDDACALLDAALRGPARRAMTEDLMRTRTLDESLRRLRECFRTNVFDVGGSRLSLERAVNALDRRTRDEGFHVLNDWDGKADHVNDTTIPMDVLDYTARTRAGEPASAAAIAILIDYYFAHLLQLSTVRVWDEGDADANLDRVETLLGLLQGPDGSGQQFAADAETLMLLATSHFELHERGYELLLGRVKTLNRAHQVKIALGHAASMGSHLRFGFEASYARDTIVMRDDNVADYPWLCYALLVVVTEYERLHAADEPAADRDRVIEALLNGLSPDARAFVGAPAAILSRCEDDRRAFQDRFEPMRDGLLHEFERFRPSERVYSPLSFFFNFSHNVVKGTIVDALLRDEAWALTFNDLLTGVPADAGRSGAKELLANTLMTYARLNPDRIRGRMMPVIVYDPAAGRQAFGVTLRRIRG